MMFEFVIIKLGTNHSLTLKIQRSYIQVFTVQPKWNRVTWPSNFFGHSRFPSLLLKYRKSDSDRDDSHTIMLCFSSFSKMSENEASTAPSFLAASFLCYPDINVI